MAPGAATPWPAGGSPDRPGSTGRTPGSRARGGEECATGPARPREGFGALWQSSGRIPRVSVRGGGGPPRRGEAQPPLAQVEQRGSGGVALREPSAQPEEPGQRECGVDRRRGGGRAPGTLGIPLDQGGRGRIEGAG